MSITQSIECPICFDIFRDPRVFSCGHTICRSCITGCFIEDYLSCPICRLKLSTDDPKDISKNYCLAGIIPEFLKLKKNSDSHGKIQEYLSRQIEDLKEQIKNLQSYLEISSGKLKIAERNLSKKKQEVEKLYKDLNRLEKKQIEGKCTVHNNIIVKLEMKIEDLNNKIRILISTYKECGGLPGVLLSDLENEFFKDRSIEEPKDGISFDVTRSFRGIEEIGNQEISKGMSFEYPIKPYVRLPSVNRSRSIVKANNENSVLDTEKNQKFNL